MRAIKRAYFVIGHYLALLLFCAVGLALNLVCALLLLWPRREIRGARVRATIRVLFDLWLRFVHAARLLVVDWRGFDQPLSRGTVYVANHPSLIDAVLLLSRLPDATCIFKASLMRNPAIGPAAILAGYVAGDDSGVDLIRRAAERVATGSSLLIFPEGTRTATGTTLGPLRAGFALIAARAAAPVQLVTIRTTPDLMRRGRPIWHVPRVMPARVEIALDQRWECEPSRHAEALNVAIEQRLLRVLSEPPGPELPDASIAR